MKLYQLNDVLSADRNGVIVSGYYSNRVLCYAYSPEKHKKYANMDVLCVKPVIKIDDDGRAVPHIQVVLIEDSEMPQKLADNFNSL